MREIGGEIVRDAVGEIVLLLIAGEVLERQHDDREARRVGELIVNRSGHETRRVARTPSKCPHRKKRESKRRSKSRPARPDAARPRRSFGRFFLRRGRALAKQVSMHRLGDVLEALPPEVGHLKLQPRLDLPVGVLRQTDPSWLANPFEPGRDVHAVAHEIAVGLLDHVAKMNADAKLDTTFGRQAGVALDHAGLHFEGAAYGVDHAPELDDRAVAGALHDAPVMHRDDGVDEIAAKRSQARKDTILVRAREPTISDDVRDQDRSKFSGLAPLASPRLRPSDLSRAREPSTSSSHELIPRKISK
jgi:hypothetical protein